MNLALQFRIHENFKLIIIFLLFIYFIHSKYCNLQCFRKLVLLLDIIPVLKQSILFFLNWVLWYLIFSGLDIPTHMLVTDEHKIKDHQWKCYETSLIITPFRFWFLHRCLTTNYVFYCLTSMEKPKLVKLQPQLNVNFLFT